MEFLACQYKGILLATHKALDHASVFDALCVSKYLIAYTVMTCRHVIDLAYSEKQSATFCSCCDKLQLSPRSGFNYIVHI